MDKSLIHRWKIFFWGGDNGHIVGLVFYENPVNDVYFSLCPEYEKLADEMVAYAVSSMPRMDDHLRFVIFGGQNAVKEAASKIGFQQSFGYIEKVFDFEQSLNYSLPDGFHFVESKKLSVEKIAEGCWKGFDHEKEEGPCDGDAEYGYYTLMAPHMNPEDSIVIENDEGSMSVMRVCGGRQKITSLIWNHYVLFQNIERKAWQQRHFQSITAGLNP